MPIRSPNAKYKQANVTKPPPTPS